MKYSKQILSDALAELGASLGRPPAPSDLRPGMAVKKTYLRWFGSWETALEYAGYTKEYITELEPAKKTQPETTNGSSDAVTVTSLSPPPRTANVRKINPYAPENIQLINLYARQVVLQGEVGVTELPYAGALTATYKPVSHARAEILLKYLTHRTRILVSKEPTDLFILRPNGEKDPFPGMIAGVYYLVSKQAALAARDLGRTTLDLIYPGLIISGHGSPVRVISRLEMLHHPKLWRCNP